MTKIALGVIPFTAQDELMRMSHLNTVLIAAKIIRIVSFEVSIVESRIVSPGIVKRRNLRNRGADKLGPEPANDADVGSKIIDDLIKNIIMNTGKGVFRSKALARVERL